MNRIKKLVVLLIKTTDIGSAIAVRLTKLTGKSSVPMHPKHFLKKRPWFVKDINKNDVILDLGSGNGQNSIKAAKKAKKVIGLEFNEELINLAKISARQSKIKNVKFTKSDLEYTLQIKSNSIDKVIFLDVLEHLKKRNQILREIKRVLKPGGKAFIGVPNKNTSWKKTQRSVGICSFSDPDHKIEFSEREIKNLIRKNGFIIENFDYGKFDIPFRGLLDIIGGFSISAYKMLDKLRIKFSLKYPNEASGFEIVVRKI